MRSLAMPPAASAETDLTSETFAQALRSLGRLDQQRDARAWLFGSATNVLHYRRRAEVRRLRAYERPAQLRVEATGLALDSIDRRRADLVTALGDLESADRETLLLFAWALSAPASTARGECFVQLS